MKWLWVFILTCCFAAVGCSDNPQEEVQQQQEEVQQQDETTENPVGLVEAAQSQAEHLIQEPVRTLVVYSYFDESVVRPIFERFTSSSGIIVQYVRDDPDKLFERLRSKRADLEADFILLPDAGNLRQATDLGLLVPVKSKKLRSTIPAYLRDAGDHWFGLIKRPRTIVYSLDRVKEAQLSTYEDLSLSKWKGKLCLLTSKRMDSQLLVATLIAHHGEARAEAIVKGWMANLAADVMSSDADLLNAIVDGQCDVGIANVSSVVSKRVKSGKNDVALFWANQQSTGVYTSIVVGAVTKFANHRQEAQLLLEWMISSDTQKLFAELSSGFPVVPRLEAGAVMKEWGSFRYDSIPSGIVGDLRVDAVILMGRAGYR